MTQELSRSSAANIFATLRFWGVPFNKRVLAEEEQTVATLLQFWRREQIWRSPNNER